MAKFNDDFSLSSAGSAPSGWTGLKIATIFSNDWRVISDASALGGKILQYNASGSTSNSERTIAWGAPGTTVGDCDVIMKFRSPSADGDSDVRIAARMDATGDNLYGGGRRPFAANLRADTVVAGADPVIVGSATVAETQSTYYKVRFNLVGTALKVKQWVATDPQPGAWDIEVTSSDHTSGRIGLNAFFSDDQTEIDWISAGTGADNADDLEPVGGPALDTIPATAYPGETITLGVTGAGATQGTGSIAINGVTQTIASWSDTSIDITVVQGDTPYGTGNAVTLTTDAGDTATGTLELVADTASGFGFVDMSSPNISDESSVAFGATPTVVTGDQFEWEDFNTLGNLIIDAEGFVSSVDTEGAFRGRFWDATDSTWGAVETFTAEVPGTVPQGTLVVQDVSVGRVSATANVSYSGTDFTRVQYSLDGQNWVNFTPPLLVLDGLERETAYTATVRVINEDGTGPTESFSFTTKTTGTIDSPVLPEEGAKYSAQRFNRHTGGGLIGLRSWKTRK